MNADRLLLVGLNHLSAELNSRERAAIAPQDMPSALKELREEAGLAELVILSTCSRVEAYAVAENLDEAARRVQSWFQKRAGSEIARALYVKKGPEALAHLFNVAAGLDSWILGESEILGQTKRAYQSALEQKTTGRVLNRAFQRAVAAGKAVRAQTGIQNGIHSIGGAAALLARRIFGAGRGVEILVLGAGQAAEAVVRHLAAKDFDRVLISNRTWEKARALAQTLGGEAIPYERSFDRLATADLAVFSISSDQTLFSPEKLRSLLLGRKRPLFLIDLGLPRNIDPACSKLEGVYLYDLDDLKNMIQKSLEKKSQEKEKAQVLIEQAVEECGTSLEAAARAAVEAVAAG